MVADELAGRIKLEGSDRINEVLGDYETQINLMAYLVYLLFAERSGTKLTVDQEQHILLGTGVQQWVRSIQMKAAELIAAQDTTYANDDHWPEPPVGSSQFIENF